MQPHSMKSYTAVHSTTQWIQWTLKTCCCCTGRKISNVGEKHCFTRLTKYRVDPWTTRMTIDRCPRSPLFFKNLNNANVNRTRSMATIGSPNAKNLGDAGAELQLNSLRVELSPAIMKGEFQHYAVYELRKTCTEQRCKRYKLTNRVYWSIWTRRPPK